MLKQINSFLKNIKKSLGIKILRGRSGVALLIAIFSLGLLSFFAMEVSYETNVEYVLASQKINRLRAYYAAKSGVELSLLRILLYKKAVATFGDQLGANKAMLDPIWSFPFAWPPSNFIPKDEVTTITYDSVKAAEKDSLMSATYITQIDNESGKIDINDLGSDIKELREQTKQQILKIFAIEIESNNVFEEKYRNFEFEELLNNITDWIDENDTRVVGGNERGIYQDFLKDNTTEFIPPNQPLKTLEELHMVFGMKDDIFNLLKDRVTVFGVKGININFANKNMLKSLDIQITDQIADEIIKRRSSPELGGPFASEDDFLQFLSTWIRADKFNEGGIPLLFDSAYNFKITSTGEFARSVREISVITYDVDTLVSRMITLLDKQDADEKGPEDPADNDKNDDGIPDKDPADSADPDKKKPDPSAANKKKNIPQGRPRVVMWSEK
jgi:general secretion pathway protein K